MGQTLKVWRAGKKTLVVTLPKTEQDIQGIKEGDFVEVHFTKRADGTPNRKKKQPTASGRPSVRTRS